MARRKLERIEPVYELVGRRLRFLRRRAGKLSGDVGSELGLHQATYSNMESANTRISVATLLRVCALLGTTPGVVLDGIGLALCQPHEGTLELRKRQGEAVRAALAAKRTPGGRGKKKAIPNKKKRQG